MVALRKEAERNKQQGKAMQKRQEKIVLSERSQANKKATEKIKKEIRRISPPRAKPHATHWVRSIEKNPQSPLGRASQQIAREMEDLTKQLNLNSPEHPPAPPANGTPRSRTPATPTTLSPVHWV